MTVMLTGAAILAARDLDTELVEVPEWGGAVYVRGLRGSERDAFEMSVQATKKGTPDLSNVRANLAAKVIIDEAGERLFSDKDVAALGQKSAIALDRIWDVAIRLSGMKAGAVDAAKKPSKADQNGDSGLS